MINIGNYKRQCIQLLSDYFASGDQSVHIVIKKLGNIMTPCSGSQSFCPFDFPFLIFPEENADYMGRCPVPQPYYVQYGVSISNPK
jgi:hypothetical protein